jgi:hypothetical protein
MRLYKPGIGLFAALFAFAATGCGELDTMLASNAVYQVNAAVEGRNLDEYAIVGINSRIRPYFLSSLKNDPDVAGLVVFIKTPAGEVVSKKVRYVPGSADYVSGQPISIDEDGDAPEDASGSPETGAGWTTPEQEASGEDVSGSVNSEKGTDGETPPPQEEPLWDDSPENEGEDEESANAGQDFFTGTTADGGLDIEQVYQIREKRTSSGYSEAADPDEIAVYVSNLDGDLPALLFPEKLAAGIYILVFQVLGPHGVLSSSEKLTYYVSDAEFSLGDIQAYHSGDMEKSGIVSPGGIIMLETRVNADSRLKPYITWYNEKQRVREGPVSGGVDRMLWQAPGKTGFQALRAEVFPFTPPESYKKTAGLAKELSLAVSSKQTGRSAGNTGIPQQEAVIRWYQLRGDFSDSLAPADAKRKLTPGGGLSTWLPKAGIYGLAAGPADPYTIPGPLFVPDKELPGRGQLVFRLALESSGTVFSGIFTLDRTSQTLKLDLSWDADAGHLTLRYALEYEERIQTLLLPSSAADAWTTVVVDFTVRGNTFRSDIGLLPAEDGKFLTELASLSDKSAPSGKGIVLPGALTGNGAFRIGASASPPALLSETLPDASPVSRSETLPDASSALPSEMPPDASPALPSETSSVSSLIPASSSALSSFLSPSSSLQAASTSVNVEQVKTSLYSASAPVMIVDAALVLFSVGEAVDETAEDEEAEADSEDAPEDAPSGPPKTRALPAGEERQPTLAVNANAPAKTVAEETVVEKDAGRGSAGEKPPLTPDTVDGVSREPGKEPPGEEDAESEPDENDLPGETEDGGTPDAYVAANPAPPVPEL